MREGRKGEFEQWGSEDHFRHLHFSVRHLPLSDISRHFSMFLRFREGELEHSQEGSVAHFWIFSIDRKLPATKTQSGDALELNQLFRDRSTYSQEMP